MLGLTVGVEVCIESFTDSNICKHSMKLVGELITKGLLKAQINYGFQSVDEK